MPPVSLLGKSSSKYDIHPRNDTILNFSPSGEVTVVVSGRNYSIPQLDLGLTNQVNKNWIVGPYLVSYNQTNLIPIESLSRPTDISFIQNWFVSFQPLPPVISLLLAVEWITRRVSPQDSDFLGVVQRWSSREGSSIVGLVRNDTDFLVSDRDGCLR